MLRTAHKAFGPEVWLRQHSWLSKLKTYLQRSSPPESVCATRALSDPHPYTPAGSAHSCAGWQWTHSISLPATHNTRQTSRVKIIKSWFSFSWNLLANAMPLMGGGCHEGWGSLNHYQADNHEWLVITTRLNIVDMLDFSQRRQNYKSK